MIRQAKMGKSSNNDYYYVYLSLFESIQTISTSETR